MAIGISDYEPIVGKSRIEELKILALRLKGKLVQNINSTAVGGGVAEILSRLIPLLNDLGVETRWDVIEGSEKFFDVTKKMHNALHGSKERFSRSDFQEYGRITEQNIKNIGLKGDIIFIHDPQPCGLIRLKKSLSAKWIWRCHIDLSNPDKKAWGFLKEYILKYDAAVFSAPGFARRLPIPQFLVSPSIDPLSDKNKELDQTFIDSVLDKYGIDRDRPIVTQISRFDYLKDPLGVIKAFDLVRKYNKCQLILAGGTAKDDPESEEVLQKVKERAAGNPDIKILLIPPNSNLEINALQRASSVIVQKSIREGFGLTVSEALWKAKPVVASAVGGITLQVRHKYSGLLCRTIEGAAHMIKQVLNNSSFARRLGENGREHIRNNFLLTRHIRDYMLMFLAAYHDSDIVNL